MNSTPRLTWLLAVVVSLAAYPVAAETYSHVRMVRLSFVEGTVTVQRPDVEQWAAAVTNLPVSEGFKLATAEDGFAEVEFEDTSTVRLGQLSQLDFNQLMTSSEGAQVDGLTLVQGYATFHAKGHGIQLFEVLAGNAAVVVQGEALFRLDLAEGQLRVICFKGAVQVTAPSYSDGLEAGQVLTLQPAADPPFLLAENVTRDAWDEWVEERESQQTSLESRRPRGLYSNDVPTLLYGMTDLDYYGTWSYFPGHGYGWYPRMRSGWTPYSIGRWGWYPGVGYTWIAGEPWGWLPYHYGMWMLDPIQGWWWFPMPQFMGQWSPGRVNWYRGPGWIGWEPQTGGSGHGQHRCPSGANCTTAVSTDTFQSGNFIDSRRRIPVDLSQGERLRQLDVSPSPLVVLPGLPVDWPARTGRPQVVPPLGQVGTKPAGTTGAATAAGSSAHSGSPANVTGRTDPIRIHPRRAPVTMGGIVFDPDRGQFVNAPDRPTTGTGKVAAPSGNALGSVGATPAQTTTPATGGSQVSPSAAPPATPTETASPRPRPTRPPSPAGVDSPSGKQPSGAQPPAGSTTGNQPAGSWGPKTPSQPARAPSTKPPATSPSPRTPATPASPGRVGTSSGAARSGGSSPTIFVKPSTSGTSTAPSNPGTSGSHRGSHGSVHPPR